MSAAEDVARMLTLVPWLLARPGASVTETAEAFGTDARTIRRDLSHLDFCGLPGLGGGDLFEIELVADRIVVRMADELSRPLRPTPREAFRLVLALDAAVAALGDELPALRTGLAKVRGSLGIAETQADVVADGPVSVLAGARQAVRDGRRVALRYQGRGDVAARERLVDAWALHVVDGVWYLQGHDEEARERRAFHLGRVRGLRVLPEPVQVPAPAELPAPRYHPGPDDLEVTLRVSPPGRWVLDALDVDTRRDLADGTVECQLRTDAPRWLVRLVIDAGGEVEVVAPAGLRAEVAAAAEEALGAADAALAGLDVAGAEP